MTPIGFQPASYTANFLNQYTSRTVPGAADIIGVADPNAPVTVNGGATFRRGEYFQRTITADNASQAVYPLVSAQTGSAAAPDGRVYLPATPEAFQYDADGNLTSDGRWSYSWNAENRLVWMESKPGTPCPAWRKLHYECDWQGRRILKQAHQAEVKNLVLPANGGSLLAYTSQDDYWPASRLTDGSRGGWGNAWSSQGAPQTPQEFIYQINNGTEATLGEVVLANYGLQELGYNCYSKDFEVYVSTSGTNAWTLALSGTLEARMGPQWFALSNVQARYVKLKLLNNYSPGNYWTLSEFEAHGTTGIPYQPTQSTRFIYDGWNLVAELNDQSAVIRSYLWGLDLSGSPQGAGGVGGLIAYGDHQSGTIRHFAVYDGNGNVTVLVDAATGEKSAVYWKSENGEQGDHAWRDIKYHKIGLQ